MRKIRNYILLAFLAGVVLLIDQITKNLVRTRLGIGEIWMPFKALRPYVDIVHTTNTGAVFGMFQQGGMVFTILAVVVSAGIIWYYRNSDSTSRLVRIALGLLLGGALGNLIDRLRFGLTVTDFIRFSVFPAVFNVADGALSLGMALLLLDAMLEYIKGRKKEPVTPAPIPQEIG